MSRLDPGPQAPHPASVKRTKKSPEPLHVRPEERFAATTPAEREFRDFYRPIEEEALSEAELIVGDYDRACDVLQECAIKFYRMWDEMTLEQRTPKYFITSVRNRAIDHLRAPQFEELPSELDDLPQLQLPSVDPLTNRIPSRDVIVPLARALPAQKRIVWLMRFHGNSNEEIASALGITADMVRKHLEVASTRMAKALFRGGFDVSFDSLVGLLQATTSEDKND